MPGDFDSCNVDVLKARISELEAELACAQQVAEKVRSSRRAQAEAEENARSAAGGTTQSETVVQCLTDTLQRPSLGQASSSGSGPPPYSPTRRTSSDTHSRHLLTKRQQGAAQEYAVTIQRIISGSTLATFGPGLDVQSVICGFDNGLIELHHLPPQATVADIEALFKAICTFCIVDIRQYEDDKVIATVAVREDIKQRVAEAVNGQVVRNKLIAARVLTTAAGHAASRHHVLYLSWKGQDPPQTFYAELRGRLATTPGIMSYELFSDTKRLIPPSLPGGGTTHGAVAWFSSDSPAKQAAGLFHWKRFAPDFPLIQCTLGSNKPLKYALVVPLEQHYLHESGDTVRYPGNAVVPEPGDLIARTKFIGYDWFDGWCWSDDERNKTFFGKDLRQQVPGIFMTKWDYLTRTLILYGDCEAAITQASDLIESHAGKSELPKFSERIESRFTKSLLRSGRLDALKGETGGGEISFNILRSQHVLTYRGRNVFFAVRRLMEEIESGGLPAEDEDGKPTCPVCLSKVSASVKLICGHEYCISCLKRCVLTSPERKCGPIVCVGNEGQCPWRIAVPVIQSLLSPLEFQKLLEKMVQGYINQHPDQFRYCITPGCTQVYRCSRGVKYLTCSSCAVTICSACHSKAHSFLSCADWRGLSRPSKEDQLTSQWASNNGTKKCPKCEVIIQKAEGCHHVHCPMCHTHICWVCLGTFNDSTDIYTHLSMVHGGIDGQATNAQALQHDFKFAQRLQAEELAEYGVGTNDSGNKSSCVIM